MAFIFNIGWPLLLYFKETVIPYFWGNFSFSVTKDFRSVFSALVLMLVGQSQAFSDYWIYVVHRFITIS
jgi:hypothetical protein